MQGFPPCTIQNLVAATRTWRGDQHLFGRASDFWEQGQFTHLHAQLNMFFFISERARHSAASGVHEFDREIFWDSQSACACPGAGKRFLVAMPV